MINIGYIIKKLLDLINRSLLKKINQFSFKKNYKYNMGITIFLKCFDMGWIKTS